MLGNVQWGSVASWVAAVGTVAAFGATTAAVWLQKIAIDKQQRQIDDERAARIADEERRQRAVREERRLMLTDALDELDELLKSLSQQLAVGHLAPIDARYLDPAYRLILHHAPEHAEPLRSARREIESHSRARQGKNGFEPNSPTAHSVERAIGALRDARTVLQNLRAALTTSQASGVRWVD